MTLSPARGIVAKGAVDLLGRVATFLTFPILALYTGPDGYGAWTQVMVIIGFIGPFAGLGLAAALVRHVAPEPWTRHQRAAIGRMLAIITLTTAVTAAVIATWAGPLNTWILGWHDGKALLRWGALLVIVGAWEGALLELFRAREWYVQYAGFQLSQTLGLVAGILWVLPQGFGLVALVQFVVIAKALFAAMAFASLWGWNRPPSSEPSTPPPFGRMVRFGLTMTLVGLGLWVMNFGDRLVIGHLLVPAELGRYAAVVTFAAILVASNAPIVLPFYTRVSRAFQLEPSERVHAEVATYHRLMGLVMVPIGVYLALEIPNLLRTLGGTGFSSAMSLSILVVAGTFVSQWNTPAHYLLASADQAHILRRGYAVAGLANLGLNWPAIMLWGLNGAALVTLVTFIGLETYLFTRASQLTPLARSYQARVALLAGIVSLGAWAIAHLVVAERTGVTALAGEAVLYMLLVAGGILALRIVRPGEIRAAVRSVFGRREATA